ncbi:autotransporter outer membrane beta-barrel domain-containing protein [Haemophilus haemolyticus]|uniref:BrkA autotransporter n=1 Tax=Haemophilus haemolyticus TaxID=726 RepID=A0A2X4R7I0_HAEHA|nr:autotransporter outer membrane beta-barrel domain-containing protein [Haemophilus haemolyticus]SQH97903.1 BrkA autotransporter precursor [Haemophilus haemolyticus]
MKYRNLLYPLVIPSIVQATDGLIEEKPEYTFVYAGKDQVNTLSPDRFDYSKRTTPINGFVIAAQGGENTLTIKGDPTLVDDVNRPKYLDGSQPKKPAHLTIDVKSELGTIEAADGDYVYETRNEALKDILTPGGLVFSDLSNTGKNHVTLENVSIANHIGDSAILINDQNNVDIAEGSADANITLKGHTYLRTDGSIVPSKERNGIAVYKNTREDSKTTVTMDKDSSLDIYVKSGSYKSRGIGITHYKDIHEFTKDMKAHKTEMDFHGPVNITLERNNQGEMQSYGVGVVSMPVLENNDLTRDLPDDAVARVTFHNDLRINVEPVLKDGKPSKIGDAINVDGKGSKVEIKGTGTVQIKGDIHVLNGAVADVNLLNKDSFFEGEAHMSKVQYTDADPDDPNYTLSTDSGVHKLFKKDRYKGKDEDTHPTAINLTMKNGARWTASNSSKIKNLDINKGANVVFSNDKNNINISVGNLQGNDGLFKIQGDIVKGTTDKLIVRKSSEGNHFIEYEDDGSAPTLGKEKLKLVEYKPEAQGKQKAKFALTYGTTDQGAYEYSLTKPGDSKIVKIESDEATKNDFYLNPTGRLSTGAQGAVILGDIIYQSNLALTESLHQRLGEIHFNKNITKQSQIWAKNIDGQYVSKGSIKVSGYTNNYLGLKIGYDWINARGNWINYNGLSFGYISSAAKSQIYPGKIKLNGPELGLYSSWLNKENDWYFDFFTKAISYSGGYDLVSPSKKSVKSPTIRTFTYILSAETGKRINLSETAERVIYLQPEAQLSYHATKRYDFTVSNKLMVETEKVRSLVGRIGFRAGLDYFNAKEIHPYIKLMYRREFLGEMKYMFNKVAVEKILNKGNWLEYGLGVSYMNKAKNTQVYFEAQSSTIHRFKQNWQAHIGIRYLF